MVGVVVVVVVVVLVVERKSSTSLRVSQYQSSVRGTFIRWDKCTIQTPR